MAKTIYTAEAFGSPLIASSGSDTGKNLVRLSLAANTSASTVCGSLKWVNATYKMAIFAKEALNTGMMELQRSMADD